MLSGFSVNPTHFKGELMAINLLNFGSRRNELYLLVGQYAAVDRYLPSQILLAVYVTQQMQVSDQEEAVTIHAIPKATELLLITATVCL